MSEQADSKPDVLAGDSTITVEPQPHISVGCKLLIDGKEIGVVTKIEVNPSGQMVGEVQLPMTYLQGHRYQVPTFSVNGFFKEMEDSKPGDLLEEVRRAALIERKQKWFLSVHRPGWVLIEAAVNEKGQALVTDTTGNMQWVDMDDGEAKEK